MRLVAGDAHIAPAVEPENSGTFRRNRNISVRADVGSALTVLFFATPVSLYTLDPQARTERAVSEAKKCPWGATAEGSSSAEPGRLWLLQSNRGVRFYGTGDLHLRTSEPAW